MLAARRGPAGASMTCLVFGVFGFVAAVALADFVAAIRERRRPVRDSDDFWKMP